MRVKGDGIHYHIIARCNNGERMFREHRDFESMLECLKNYAILHHCKVHHYVIMPSHIHLMLMTADGHHIDTVMHDFCLAVAKDYNKRNARSGHFWRHRYRSKIIADDRYAVACMRYFDLNPVSAGLVKSAAEWQWSSHRYYAAGAPDEIITPHTSYELFGRSDVERRKEYSEFVAAAPIVTRSEQRLFDGIYEEGSRRFGKAYKGAINSVSMFLNQHGERHAR